MVFGVSHDSVSATCGQKQPLLLPEHIPITLLTLLFSFFFSQKLKVLGWVTYLWGCQTPLSPSWLKGVAVAQPIFTHCSLSKVKVSTLLSGCHVREWQLESREDSKRVKLTAPACLSDCLAATDCCFWLRLAPPLTGGCEDSTVTSSLHQLSTTAFTWKQNQIRKYRLCP